MASITGARLSIEPIAGTGTARCVVTARVNFTDFEMEQIRQGLKFRLDCQLWGDDPVFDDFLYSYASKFLPQSTPTQSEAVRFEEILSKSILNEDICGRDEVYGRLILTNLYTEIRVTVHTNTIKRRF